MTKYIAKIPNEQGFIDYTEEENQVWHDLFERQQKIIQNRASDEFIEGIHLLGMASDHIPQIPDMNAALKKATGWQVHPVAALISNEEFFGLLTEKKFPAATFIRRRDELDYLQEPDIFHEFFGHCPMLTNQSYADFTQIYARKTLEARPEDRPYLARLYWFTIEFGLVNTSNGLRIYGGGILSSKEETIYSLESPIPLRLPLGNGLDALRTPYRIDILQPIYYVLGHPDELFNLVNDDLFDTIHKAQDLGDFPPRFDPTDMETYSC
ncbi:MAG: phenylalanine 4-monooxygenase [Gammaproteobacteria bacterium]|nr:phenylalanine 4-monooxygenase [Gammaproteobacteria bacterium]